MRMATCVVAAAPGGAVVADIAPDELARQAIAAVKREPNWQEIKVDRAKPTDYSVTLVYKTQPGGGDETHYVPARLFSIVERDTTAIVRGVLR